MLRPVLTPEEEPCVSSGPLSDVSGFHGPMHSVRDAVVAGFSHLLSVGFGLLGYCCWLQPSVLFRRSYLALGVLFSGPVQCMMLSSCHDFSFTTRPPGSFVRNLKSKRLQSLNLSLTQVLKTPTDVGRKHPSLTLPFTCLMPLFRRELHWLVVNVNLGSLDHLSTRPVPSFLNLYLRSESSIHNSPLLKCPNPTLPF